MATSLPAFLGLVCVQFALPLGVLFGGEIKGRTYHPIGDVVLRSLVTSGVAGRSFLVSESECPRWTFDGLAPNKEFSRASVFFFFRVVPVVAVDGGLAPGTRRLAPDDCPLDGFGVPDRFGERVPEDGERAPEDFSERALVIDDWVSSTFLLFVEMYRGVERVFRRVAISSADGRIKVLVAGSIRGGKMTMRPASNVKDFSESS